MQAMMSGPADLVQVVRACSSVAETCPAGDDVEPKAKRAKKHVHLDCIRFCFDNCDILAERNKRSRAHCLRNLTEMAPEVYGKLHEATPARWKRSEEDTHKKDFVFGCILCTLFPLFLSVHSCKHGRIRSGRGRRRPPQWHEQGLFCW